MKNHSSKYKTYTKLSFPVSITKNTFLYGKDQPLMNLNKSFGENHFQYILSESPKHFLFVEFMSQIGIIRQWTGIIF
jgi:hypothetical protein